MKIEWLNADCTEAIVTRGWFRKSQARVRWHASTEKSGWRYAANDEQCEDWLCAALYDADARERRIRTEARKRSAWQPVARFPKARLLERKL